jgi:hypothetical protein
VKSIKVVTLFVAKFLICCAMPAPAFAQLPTANDTARHVGPLTSCRSDFSPSAKANCLQESLAPATPTSAAIPPSNPSITRTAPVLTPARNEIPVASPSAPAIATKSAVIGGVSDKEVEDFLQRWGKPSSEAVRATLNPTDENIAAMRKRNMADVALARYIGNRSAQIDPTSSSPQNVESLGVGEAPALIRMKVILYTGIKCPACDRQITGLQTLTTQAPMLDASIAVVGNVSEKDLIIELARLGVVLPMRIAPPGEINRLGKNPPFFHVVDLKNQSEGTLPSATESDEIKLSIINFRKTNDTLMAKKGDKK